MDFTVTHDYPAALDTLWAAFGQPEYPRRKYFALGATAVRLRRFHATAKSIEVELERDIPMQSSILPKWARAFVGGELTVRHRSAWHRVDATQAQAELDIAPAGLPVSARGIGSIVETAPGVTRMVLKWHVGSAFGERIARVFGDQVRAALDEDHAFTLKYLKQDGRGTGQVAKD